MNKKAIWEILNEFTVIFVKTNPEPSHEHLMMFIQERKEMMLAATGEPYYAWWIS